MNETPETTPAEEITTPPEETTVTPEEISEETTPETTPAEETPIAEEVPAIDPMAVPAPTMPETPVVSMPNEEIVKPEAPEELLPVAGESVAKSTMRSTYLAFWKATPEKWEAEKEALMAKLNGLE